MLNTTIAAYPFLSKQNRKAFLPHHKGYLAVPRWAPTPIALPSKRTKSQYPMARFGVR